MAHYINVAEFYNNLFEKYKMHYWRGLKLGEIQYELYKFPPADVAPVVHAHFKWHGYVTIEGLHKHYWTCSKCGQKYNAIVPVRYCLNCGAKLDGVIEHAANI